jgi:hypothetical protein
MGELTRSMNRYQSKLAETGSRVRELGQVAHQLDVTVRAAPPWYPVAGTSL